MKIDRRVFLALATSLAATTAAACASNDEEAETGTADIINGQADTMHEAVVAIRWRIYSPTGESGAICTGTLVGPHTVLTAAHCVVPEKPDQRFARYEVYFGNTPAAQSPQGWIKVIQTKAHPKFSYAAMFDRSVKTFDVALLTLEQDVSVKPLKVATQIDGDLTTSKITHVGFGATMSLARDQKYGAGAQKFQVSLPVTEQLEFLLKTGNGVSGICNGDSGGPALMRVDGEDVVIGVHSWIDDAAHCLQNGYSARTDAMTDFIFSADLPATRFGQRVEAPRPFTAGGASFRARICPVTSSDGIGNLRAKATTSSAILHEVPNGVAVSVTGKTGEWYSVEFEDDKGFMHQSVLKRDPCGSNPANVP